MTATLPDGMEYKNLDAVADTVWGSEYPEEDGVHNHIVAVTGVRDEVGDIIVPGAFEHTLQRIEPKACMGHDWNRPIGYPEAIKELLPGDPRLPKTDRFGKPWPAKAGALFARTRYNLDTDDGQRAYKDARFLGPRLACSIGYVDPKDDNGNPLHSYKAIDPDTGLMTRFLPRLDLFEYSQVLHGAHLLAGGVKDGKPKRLERKQRPSMEIKATVKLVRDSAYWRLPVGTPIRPGMKPQGPKAQRISSAGQQPDENVGVVEVDATNLRIKPTAKGKLKGSKAIDIAFGGALELFGSLGEHNPNLATLPDGKPVIVDPFDNASFVVEDSESINKGGLYNPLDILVANAIPPAEAEEHLRNNSDWDADRLGDAADRQDEIDAYIADVVDAYREKYNAELVRQNDTGDSEVADSAAPDAEAAPGAEAGDRPARDGIRSGDLVPGSTFLNEENGRMVTVGEVQSSPKNPGHTIIRGTDSEGEIYDALAQDDTLLPAAQGEELPASTEDALTGDVPEIPPGESAEDIPEALHGAPAAEPVAVPAKDEPIGRFPDGTLPSPKLIAALGNATWVTGEKMPKSAGVDKADGWLVTGHGNTVIPLLRKNVANGTWKGGNNYLLTEEGAQLLAPYLPGGGRREDAEAAPDSSATPSVNAPQTPAAGQAAPVTAPGRQPATGLQALSDEELESQLADSRAQLEKIQGLVTRQESTGGVSDSVRAAQVEAGNHNRILEQEASRRGAVTSEGAAGDPLGETDSGTGTPDSEVAPDDEPLVENVDQAEAIAEDEVVDTEELASDEIADAETIADAGYGITESPDGEFEVDADIADRQDRVASLLTQAEAGSLDFSAAPDDQLRVTRADIVDELKLQQHLERRHSDQPAVTRQQAETEAADSLTPQENEDRPVAETGPKPRPGVAGAAEDLADALDDGDSERVDAATERLRKSVNRSRSDSEVVAEIRAMLDPPSTESDPITGEPLPGKPDPGALRDTATRLRDEQRAKRNEGARRRRTARRFERERLRSLLGQVEAEMRNRNLDYDPIPDADGNVTLELDSTPPVAWSSTVEKESWSGFHTRVDDLNGANYSARIVVDVSPQITTRHPPEYRWTVTSDDGAVLATGKSTAPDMDSARASVEIALDTQRRLGLIPVDAQIPQGSVPEDTSATPLADVVDSIGQMRQRLADGRTLNPITGRPDPLGDTLPPLPVPAAPMFDDAGAIRKHLEVSGVSAARNGVPPAGLYRWDTAKMTPGGAFVVVDDLKGKPQVVHSVTGATFNPYLPNVKTSLNRVDLLRYATIAESTPDRDGKPVDWSQGGKALMADMTSRSFQADGDGLGGRGLQAVAIDRLTREKIHAGQFAHALVLASEPTIHDVTNPTRKSYVKDQHRTLGQLINVRAGKPDAFDKNTLNAANGARALAALGAPDAAAVLLTRRAAEIREQHGGDAPSRGAAVLDTLARGYLGMFSPARSHGERVGSLKAGERVFLPGDGEDEPPRGFRALGAARQDSRSAPGNTITPVIDEKTGEQMFLHAGLGTFKITDSDQAFYGHTPLSADRGSGVFTVVGPGEEPPTTMEDLTARAFDDAAVIPQDVLDAAAEALPESRGETAARRATPGAGVRAPRKGTTRAPARTAQPLAAPEPVRNEQQLAEAQGRTLGAFLGMPFEYGGPPEQGNFDSVDAVREHLAALSTGEKWKEDPRRAGSADAVLREIDAGETQLSPGGVFLVRKNGTVTHASTSFSVWPPTSTSKAAFDDFNAGGAVPNQGAGLRVARALESGLFDGEQLDWSGDGVTAINRARTIGLRNGKSHPVVTAQRAAYLDGALDTAKPRVTDVQMLRGMTRDVEVETPNPEALSGTGVIEQLNTYERAGGTGTGNFTSGMSRAVADTKAGSALAKRAALEIRIAEALATTAPLDAVRRLNRVADELDGKTVTRVSTQDGDDTGALVPSDDLRAIASKITDAFDPAKISESGRFRAAGMAGRVEFTTPRVTSGQSWQDPNGVAARELEKRVRDAGGIRFYRDANGMLHATFAGVDIADGQHNGKTFDGDSIALNGAIKLYSDGTLNVSYTQASRLMIIEGPPGAWKFTPDESANEDTGVDTSGPETESVQVKDGTETDIGAADEPADEDKE